MLKRWEWGDEELKNRKGGKEEKGVGEILIDSLGMFDDNNDEDGEENQQCLFIIARTWKQPRCP